MNVSPLFLGIDIGTSGCRAIVMDQRGNIHAQSGTPLPESLRQGQQVIQDPQLWWTAVKKIIREITSIVPGGTIAALAVDGTSSSILLADNEGQPLTPALMYNDSSALAQAKSIELVAPKNSAAHGPSSGLAKLLLLQQQIKVIHARYVLHQADWIAAQFSGIFGVSDTNNCLKLGYDPLAKCWPKWLEQLNVRLSLLPQVLEPGTVIGKVVSSVATELGLDKSTWVVAGTTDSTAGILATGAHEIGDAVTSLGSTTVCKIISEFPIFAPESGIYSQPLNNRWLVGGGSNAGGTTLRQLFTVEQIDWMTPLLNPEIPTGLDYYPLPAPGERFPVADPNLLPRLNPRPADDIQFFQGILEGLARIELTSYRLLHSLGAPFPASIRTIGGGAKNGNWALIRQGLLQVPIIKANQQEAAYGSALLARLGYLSKQGPTL